MRFIHWSLLALSAGCASAGPASRGAELADLAADCAYSNKLLATIFDLSRDKAATEEERRGFAAASRDRKLESGYFWDAARALAGEERAKARYALAYQRQLGGKDVAAELKTGLIERATTAVAACRIERKNRASELDAAAQAWRARPGSGAPASQPDALR